MKAMARDADFLKRVLNMQTGMSGDLRAPHKPLLALWAIGRCVRREQRLVSYKQIDEELARLMSLFGPHGRPKNTHYPFWRMLNDGIWEVDRPELVRTTKSNDAYKLDLLRHQICGGLTATDYATLQNNPMLARRIAGELVARHFPQSIHEEVLEATIFPVSPPYLDESECRVDWLVTKRRWRDPTFRARVLSAYKGTCAVCEFSGRFLDLDQPLAIEAAHVKWHECDGPALVENGLALCALHHRLFDKGAFTVLPDLTVIVSPAVRGDGVDNALGQYDNKYLHVRPRKGFPPPRPEFLHWHGNEVFKSPKLLDSV